MPVLTNIGQLARCCLSGGQGDLHVLSDAALAWEGAAISWVGPAAELPARFALQQRFDAQRRLVIPGLVDCHTHLAFGGWRADEFEQRIKGKSYLEIAASGGGIQRTVEATRRTPEKELVLRGSGFLAEMVKLGITTVECKSGYGLDVETELKLLRVYAALRETQPVKLVSTFLAHTVPPEFRQARADYVALLCRELIPEIARRRLAEFCDVFVEDSAFSAKEARSILETAAGCGLKPRLHADQLTSVGAAELAAELAASSADHLERVSEAGIAALASAGVVAVSLPVATLYLGTPPMPARRLIEAGAPVAVSTDFNPGSAPTFHLPFAMTLACLLQRMTPAEVLKGATAYAAKALGRESDRGALEPGKAADFVIVDAQDVNQWLYHLRPNACLAAFIDGNQVAGHPVRIS
jgi:imidazolonepropionase